MEHWLYVTLLLILVHDSGDGFAHSGIKENTCYWQNATELVTKQLPEDKLPYLYVAQHGRHHMSYSLQGYAASLHLSFNYWVKQGNVSIVVQDEHHRLQSVEQEKWSSYRKTFKKLSSTQILIIVHLDDEGVFALTELQMKIRNEQKSVTKLLCTSSDECDQWRYQGFQWNIYHPYFVVGNDTKVEGFTDSIGRHEVFSLSSQKRTEQELFIKYYLNGVPNKKAELILLYNSEISEPIELWRDDELQPVWKTLSVSTETYIRPNDNYSIAIEANTDSDTMIALSSLYCTQKETVPSINYASKVQSSLDFFNTGWIIESDSKWRHNDSYDEWYLYLSSEDRQAYFRSWWIVPKKENFLRLNYRKVGEGETKIAIYLKNENNQKRILKRLTVDNSQWKSANIPFSIASDFYISIKGIVNGEETQLHLTQLSVNDPCHPDPCLEGKCIVNNEINFECQCNFGFIGTRCELTDWCSLYNGNITGYDFCTERNASCLNVMDSDTFTCVCDNKLQYFNIDNGCMDVDLCILKKCQPNAICKNNKCQCRDHYEPKKIENKLICEPINYCKRRVCGEAKCTPGNDDRPEDYKCYCDPGFVYRDKKCENNLCNFPAFNQCEQQCLVIDDHYQCSCYNGFDLVNNSTCDITEGWNLCHNMQCDNGTCVMNLSTNITSCACNVGYVYSEGKCTDYCSFNNGTLPENICPSGKCVADSKHVYKCLCEGEYEISEDGITCISRNWCRENEKGYLSCSKKNATCVLKDNSYSCVCPLGTEEDENKICTNILHIRKYEEECLSQNARLHLDAENKAICICPPFTSFVQGKCSFSRLTYSGILAVTKKFLVKDPTAYLRNIIDESMIQIFKKSGTEVDYRASAILDCLDDKTDFVCKITLFFNQEADKKVNLIRNSATCINDTEYCIIPPRLIVNRRKLRTIFFNRTDFCRDASRYYCPEQTYCQNNVIPETGFTCKCQPGYQPYNIYYPDNSMAVMVEQCKDIDECHPKNPCTKNSNCVNTMGSYECRCSHEYRPKYQDEHHKLECVPVCDPNPCEHGECIKMPEGFKCRCDAGFTGVLCDEEDINFKNMCNKLIITGSVLGGALLITLVVAYAFRMRAKKKLEKKTTQIIQMRGISNEGFAD